MHYYTATPESSQHVSLEFYILRMWQCCFNKGVAMPETVWLEFLNPVPSSKEAVEIPPG